MTSEACNLVDHPGGFTIPDRALAYCGFPAGSRLLDVGCGSGETVRHLIREYALDVHGIDRDHHSMRNQSYLTCAQGENLPFRDGEMDGVLLECSLSVMDDPDLVLKECHRVLKSNGHLMISDVYARGKAAHLMGCLGRVDTREVILARVARQGFEIRGFEDFSEHLRALWGQRVLDMGAAAFCAELGANRATLKAVNCGYCLVVARRSDP